MRLDHLLSKDRSKGCVSGKLSCVKNPAPREMEDIGRGTGSPEDGSHLPGRTRREAPLDAHRPECGAYGTISPEHCVESILSEILIESMEHLMHLSEKTPSNLRTSENGWREKYQSFMNSPSTLACCQNSMGLETTV